MFENEKKHQQNAVRHRRRTDWRTVGIAHRQRHMRIERAMPFRLVAFIHAGNTRRMLTGFFGHVREISENKGRNGFMPMHILGQISGGSRPAALYHKNMRKKRIV